MWRMLCCVSVVMTSATLGADFAPSALEQLGDRADIEGTAFDAISGLPIEGAAVRVVSSSLGTRTNASGRFLILGDPERVLEGAGFELEISHPCFHTVRIEIEALSEPLTIGMPFRTPRYPDGSPVGGVCTLYGNAPHEM